MLTKEAIGSATSFGREMRVHGNELIFARGDRSVDLFLALDCEIVIYESGPEGKECEVASVRSGVVAQNDLLLALGHFNIIRY